MDEGGSVPAHVGRVHVIVVDVDPVQADLQALGQQAAQQRAVGVGLHTTDFADAGQAAERARLTRAAKGHELVWSHVYRDALGWLASGLHQLLGELGKEPVWHGGMVHHEHCHDDRGMARTGAQEWASVWGLGQFLMSFISCG